MADQQKEELMKEDTIKTDKINEIMDEEENMKDKDNFIL